MVDTKLLTFLKLCDTMNYRMASQLLHITQPAVTQHIQALEAEYGCKLFQYEGHKLFLTAKGEQLQLYARESVSRERRLLEAIREPERTVLRIGATKTIGAYVLGGMLRQFLQDPHNLADVCVANTEILLQMLNHDELDFAMVEGFFDKSKYGWQTMKEEAFVGICAKEHPFAGKKVMLEEIFSQTLILREKGSGTRAILEEVLREHNYATAQFERILCVNDFLLIERLVGQGSGISFVYETVAASCPQLAVFWLSGHEIRREFNYVYLNNTDVPSYLSWLDPMPV